MGNNIWYIEITKNKTKKLKPDLQLRLKMIREEEGKRFESIEVVVASGEKKELFILSLDEIKALVGNGKYKDCFEIFGFWEGEKLPQKISKDVFKRLVSKKNGVN